MENIVGVLIATIVGMMILPHFQSMVQQGTGFSVDATTSGQFRSLLEAGQKYTDKHSEELANSVPVNGSAVSVPLSTLVSDSDLLPGFTAINPYGQTWAVYLMQPVSGTLSVVVESQGGSTISGTDEVRIASGTGAQGGYVPYDGMFGHLSSSTATGASGSWSLPLTSVPNPGAGHLVGLLQYSNAPVTNPDYIYRDQVQGHPEFQTMNAALDMNGNNINAANDVNATRGLFAGGNPNGGYGGVQVGNAWVYGDDTNAAIRTPSSGGVFMQHTDGSNADLTAGGARFSGNIGTHGYDPENGLPEGWFGGVHSWDGYFEGTVAVGTQGSVLGFLDTSGYGYVDDTMTSGNQMVTKTRFYVQDPGCGFQVGDVQFCGDSYNAVINAPGATYFHHGDGTNGDIVASSALLDNVQLGTANGSAVRGNGCSPNGMIAQQASGDGTIMTCLNGLWTPLSAGLHITTYVLNDGEDAIADLGEHLMCALAGSFEENATYTTPNATRVVPNGVAPDGGVMWVLSRGARNALGGTAVCIDLDGTATVQATNATISYAN